MTDFPLPLTSPDDGEIVFVANIFSNQSYMVSYRQAYIAEREHGLLFESKKDADRYLEYWETERRIT